MVNAITTFISNFFLGLIIRLHNLLVELLQNGYDGMIDFMISIIGLFPDGPPLPAIVSTPVGETFTVFLSALNWFFPISFMLDMVQWLATGYVLFLFVAPIARFFKLVT